MIRRLPCVLLFLLASTLPATAQSPAPRTLLAGGVQASGKVMDVARMPDGSLLVGGEFSAVNGVARRNLARVAPDGQVDASWNPDPDLPVRDLEVDAAGNVFVSGSFTRIGGLARALVAKLSPVDGRADPGWAPVVTHAAHVKSGPPGSVFLSGNFSTVNGVPRAGVAKLSSADAAVDPVWQPSPSSRASVAAYDAAGARVYLVGDFTSAGGAPRARLARVDATHGVADAWNPAPDGAVYDVVPDDAGRVYVLGAFNAIGGAARANVARLSSTTGTPDGFGAVAAGGSIAVLRVEQGHVYLGGSFSHVNGVAQPFLARLDAASGVLDPGFAPVLSDPALILAQPGDGGVYAGFHQRHADGEVRAGLAAFDGATGALRGPLHVTAPGIVNIIEPAPGGALVVAGNFLLIDGQPRRHAARLLPDGQVDPAWLPQIDDAPTDLGVDPRNGDVLVAQRAGTRQTIRRLSSVDGARDAAWVPAIDSLSGFAVAADGALYVTQHFFDTPKGIVKLDPDGRRNSAWQITANANPNAVFAGADGWIYAAGEFTSIGGAARTRLARLHAVTGLADPAWAPVAREGHVSDLLALDGSVYVADSIAGLYKIQGGAVVAWPDPGSGADLTTVDEAYALAADSRGFLYVGGRIQRYWEGSDMRLVGRLARDTGTWDPAWHPRPFHVFGTGVSALIVDVLGDVVVGGNFLRMGTQRREGIAVLPPQAPPADRVFEGRFEAR